MTIIKNLIKVTAPHIHTCMTGVGFCSGFVEEGLSQKGKKETGTKEGKKEICLVRLFL